MRLHVGLFCFTCISWYGHSRGGGRVKIFHVKLEHAFFAEKKLK